MNLRSGYPFWLVKNGLPYDYPKLLQNMKADVVIIGGGISGALMGYYLAKENVNCIIVDTRTIGLGSTCASTSLLQYEIDTPLVKLKDMIGIKKAVRAYQLCAKSIDTLGNIAKEIGFKDFTFKKSLYYAAKQKHLKFLREEFAIRRENGFDVTYLDAGEIKAQFGFEATGAILSAIGAQTNAYAFTHALHQYSISKGVKVFDRTEVVSIKHKQQGVKMQTATGVYIEAGTLVYANGYEAANYIDKKIVKLESTFAVISEHKEDSQPVWSNDVLIWNTNDPYLYMRTTGDGRILVGGRDEAFYDPKRRDKLLPYKTKSLVKDFNTLFPAVKFVPEFSWAGTFGATKDGLPYIGNYKELPNSLFALGFGGNGITFSLIAAEILSDLIKGRDNADAAIFSFNRN